MDPPGNALPPPQPTMQEMIHQGIQAAMQQQHELHYQQMQQQRALFEQQVALLGAQLKDAQAGMMAPLPPVVPVPPQEPAAVPPVVQPVPVAQQPDVHMEQAAPPLPAPGALQPALAHVPEVRHWDKALMDPTKLYPQAVVKLTISNFNTWRFAAEQVLRSMTLWNMIWQLPDESDQLAANWTRTGQQLAKTHLLSWMTPEITSRVRNCSTPADMLNLLDAEFNAKSTANRLLVRARLASISLADGAKVKNLLDDFESALNDYYAVGGTISNEDVQAMLLAALPPTPQWTAFKPNIYLRSEPLTWVGLKSAILTSESLNEFDNLKIGGVSNALSVTTKKGHTQKSNFHKQNSNSNSSEKKKKGCEKCGYTNHKTAEHDDELF
jgi:hypothetical protein